MPTDNQIAKHLFVSTRSLRELRASGVLPAIGTDIDINRHAYIIHMREAAAGRVKQSAPSDIDAQRSRLASEQADAIARQNAIARRELVPIAPIVTAVSGMIAVAKTKLARVGAKVCDGDPVLRQRVNKAIEDALRDLSLTGLAAQLGKGDDASG